jgi:hypothetical protein
MKPKEELPKKTVWVNAQECFTESDEAGDMKKRIWRELMQRQAIHKERPTKKIMGRKR